ncbi:MAG: phospholipase D family protein [Halioglobus sp.]
MTSTPHPFLALYRSFSLLAVLLLVQACTSVPFDYPREPSTSLAATTDTRLGAFANSWSVQNGQQSGFLSLPDGIGALGARLKLIEAAQQSIDAQYFILKKDRVGALFTGKLLRAADRGVRVRLLIDDIFSPGLDSPLTLLNTHPQIEVRLFNPVSRNSLRYWGMLLDFKRANRRMHNKSFTVDGSMSIVGGRNIGEEYFELKQSVKFDDYEILTVGPAVTEISAGFDAYWNSELAVPIEAFGRKVKPQELNDWRELVLRDVASAENGIYGPAVNSRKIKAVTDEEEEFVAANATVVIDTPAKLTGAVGDATLATLAVDVGKRFRQAQSEIVIITPYFIPQETGAQLLADIVAKGVRVVVVTNSLASTNHIPVHSRYTKYRRQLLGKGVEFYEIRVDRAEQESEWGFNPERITLHSKASMIDKETIFVGSLNFDPRSLLLNTEMGLFVESPILGRQFSNSLNTELHKTAYRVALNADGKTRWYWEPEDDEHEMYTSEPQASVGRRIMTNLYKLVPIEGQL